MTDPHKQMGRVLAKARADLDDINRRGQGDITPVTRKLTEAELREVFPDLEPQEPAPEPVWPMLLAVAAGVLMAFAIGYGAQSFWMEGM